MSAAVGPCLWVANLDAETQWAPPPHGPLRRRVLDRLAVAGSLLRCACREGDVLWLPAPLDPSRLPPLPGVPEPRLVTGAPADVLRRFPAHRPRPWADAPPWAEGERARLAARVNDRRFALELARRLGLADAAARGVASLGELRRHLAATGRRRWVVKAPYSASGRERHVHLEGDFEAADEGRVERLLQRHGELVFEPWHRRVLDVGVLFDIEPGEDPEPRLHRQIVDRRGAVTSIRWSLDGDPRVPGAEQLLDAARRVAAALEAEGYRGPAGLDAWRHETGQGEERWHLLGEINARWSVGRLARLAAEQALPKESSADRKVEMHLVFGDADEWKEARRSDSPGRRTWPLVLPDAAGDGAAWLEAMPTTGGDSPTPPREPSQGPRRRGDDG